MNPAISAILLDMLGLCFTFVLGMYCIRLYPSWSYQFRRDVAVMAPRSYLAAMLLLYLPSYQAFASTSGKIRTAQQPSSPAAQQPFMERLGHVTHVLRLDFATFWTLHQWPTLPRWLSLWYPYLRIEMFDVCHFEYHQISASILSTNIYKYLQTIIYIYIYIYNHIHIYIYTYIHIHIYIYTHTYTVLLLS